MARVSTFRSAEARAEFCQLYDAAVAESPIPITESDIETSWGRTHVLAAGESLKPPLVAIHGKSFNATSWLPLLPALSVNYRVTMIDVVGDLTKSIATKPIAKAHHVVAWLDETLRELGIQRAAFSGMSFGAWMASNYAMTFPDRVDRLALLGPAGLASGQHVGWIVRAWGASVVHPEERRVQVFLDTMATQSGYRRLREDPWRLIREQFVSGTMGFRHAMVTARPTRCDLSRLASAQFPILAIVGRDESVHDGPKWAARFRQQVPGARVELVDGANHIVPVDQPEIVEQLLADFLESSA
ncbi:MAG: alpha/beta hydrolase [Mycobacterium sp.]|uniref:alpha/beta fold hydrolase n=1 Tax=Mycobacterium sp. TaxID=1785 RepID=UPI001ECB6323|nr:alpha/beta hydrolase [Mycobacterium sp.]MBW0018159.1 alpha/beta hydrolase [Mycobacterium sp.]